MAAEQASFLAFPDRLAFDHHDAASAPLHCAPPPDSSVLRVGRALTPRHSNASRMTSRALRPALRGSWTGRAGLRVECHLVPDIVRGSPVLARAGALVTPANERLAGTQRSYFPRGGPCPPPPPAGLATSEWGGMEAGPNMVYPTQCVDGAVHAWGGAGLKEACRAAGGRCAVGGAVATPARGRLAEHFSTVVHAVAPFRSDPRWRALLEETYATALRVAVGGGARAVALPLLGAGARGAGVEEAAEVAAGAVAAFEHDATVLLCVVDPAVAGTLMAQLDLVLAVDAAAGEDGR